MKRKKSETTTSPTERKLEEKVRNEIEAHFGSRLDMRFFPNPRGNGWVGKVIGRGVTNGKEWVKIESPRRVEYGLFDGASDWIGYVTIDGVAVFFSPEAKSPTGQPTEEQITWINNVKAAGGIAGIVRSIEDFQMLIDDWKEKRAKHLAAEVGNENAEESGTAFEEGYF